jgi:hypothetical protein
MAVLTEVYENCPNRSVGTHTRSASQHHARIHWRRRRRRRHCTWRRPRLWEAGRKGGAGGIGVRRQEAGASHLRSGAQWDLDDIVTRERRRYGAAAAAAAAATAAAAACRCDGSIGNQHRRWHRRRRWSRAGRLLHPHHCESEPARERHRSHAARRGRRHAACAAATRQPRAHEGWCGVLQERLAAIGSIASPSGAKSCFSPNRPNRCVFESEKLG